MTTSIYQLDREAMAAMLKWSKAQEEADKKLAQNMTRQSFCLISGP